jgi:hypothetical protein
MIRFDFPLGFQPEIEAITRRKSSRFPFVVRQFTNRHVEFSEGLFLTWLALSLGFALSPIALVLRECHR